jgi:hypothetical protein
MAIDQWLPQYQVSARYSTHVHAPDEQIYAVLKRTRFSDLFIVRVLMRVRGYRIDRSTSSESATNDGERGSFLELGAVPPHEVVLGIAGRFWRPDGGIVRDLTPAEFVDFHREGWAKAVWSFSLAPANGGTRLSTETRVTFGRSATLKFRVYWLFIGPFSALIRKAMLRGVKRLAERTA